MWILYPCLSGLIHWHWGNRNSDVIQGLYSPSGRATHRKISWSLKTARLGFRLFQSLWNMTGTSTAALSRCLSNFRAMRLLWHLILRLETSRDLAVRRPFAYWIEALKGGGKISQYQTTTKLNKTVNARFLKYTLCGAKPWSYLVLTSFAI